MTIGHRKHRTPDNWAELKGKHVPWDRAERDDRTLHDRPHDVVRSFIERVVDTAISEAAVYALETQDDFTVEVDLPFV
jgi:hypothetical protein